MIHPINMVFILGKGRGLIANRSIFKGEVLVSDPCIVISEDDWLHIEKTVLKQYVWFCFDAQVVQRLYCFGLSAFVNHSQEPNLEKVFQTNESGVLLILRASRDIALGEELTIRYAAPEILGLE